MNHKIAILRGNIKNATGPLKIGQPAFDTETKYLYIGKDNTTNLKDYTPEDSIRAYKADQLSTARRIQISNSDGSSTTTGETFDGTSSINLKLPGNIKVNNLEATSSIYVTGEDANITLDRQGRVTSEGVRTKYLAHPLGAQPIELRTDLETIDSSTYYKGKIHTDSVLGNTTGTTETTDRKIEHIFEENSNTVKNATNATNAINSIYDSTKEEYFPWTISKSGNDDLPYLSLTYEKRYKVDSFRNWEDQWVSSSSSNYLAYKVPSGNGFFILRIFATIGQTGSGPKFIHSLFEGVIVAYSGTTFPCPMSVVRNTNSNINAKLISLKVETVNNEIRIYRDRILTESGELNMSTDDIWIENIEISSL